MLRSGCAKTTRFQRIWARAAISFSDTCAKTTTTLLVFFGGVECVFDLGAVRVFLNKEYVCVGVRLCIHAGGKSSFAVEPINSKQE